jgi:hypothetical protein
MTRLGIGTSGQVLTVSGGGIPSWAAVSASNLGSANLTSADDARTFTLKSGGTATQNLKFANSGGGNLIQLKGDNTIDFGSSSNYINSNFYCNPTTNTNFNVLRGTDVYIQSDVASYATYFRGSSWSKIIVLSHDVGQVSVAGSVAGFFALNNTGTETIIQRLDANGAWIVYRNSANANIFAIDANSAVAGIIGDFGVGAFGPYAARLYVKGSGSTSATTTALFQNSSSAKSLEILDSGAINIYNSGGFRTAYLNVYGGGVFGGNNNGTIGADPNNVLGGSYLNGIILGGYNNTHNGYQGVIGGGFNTVTTNGTWNFVFSVGSTASAVAASVFGGSGHTASGAYSAVLGGEQNTASGIGAVAIGGNQVSASGYRSFAQGYGASATSDYAVVMGSYCSASARSARAVGEFCVASGVSSWVSGLGTNYGAGQQLIASGLVSFNHSYNDATVLYRAAEGDYSVILGGKNHWTKSGSTSSAIIGGEGNTINASVVRSVILGGSAITATASDTAYAININATTLITTPQVITTPATITVAANAGTVTRANRINKFTNSSAATMTITMSTTAALDGDVVQVRIYDFSAATQTITWVNTENSSITVPATSNGSTTLPLTVGFQYNSATSKWRCIGSV